MKIKSKKHKKYVTKGKPKFEDHQNCLKTTQLEKKKKKKETRKNKVKKDNFRKNQREFIKINKSILKSQQIFRRIKFLIIQIEY